MPLTRHVSFETLIEQSNKVQIPKIIRWEFKLETNQTLKVSVSVPDLLTGHRSFFAKMMKDGRIRLPKIVFLSLKGSQPSLAGYIFEVSLEPV